MLRSFKVDDIDQTRQEIADIPEDVRGVLIAALNMFIDNLRVIIEGEVFSPEKIGNAARSHRVKGLMPERKRQAEEDREASIAV